MPEKYKPVRLWEWSNQTARDTSSATRISLSFPEDAQQSGTTLIPVVNKTFHNETAILDGRNFINCEFRQSNIQWNGNDFIFTNCTFHGPQKLVTSLPEIATALKLATICNLLDENTRSAETVSDRKGK